MKLANVEPRKPFYTSIFSTLSAQNILFSQFARLPKGSLVIEDDEGQYVFGDRKADEEHRAHIRIHSPKVYGKILWGGELAAAESYLQGMWSSPDLVKVIRVICMNRDNLEHMNFSWSILKRSLVNFVTACAPNNRVRAKRNIAQHYDLSNDFFSLFLDPTMMYSSAIYAKDHMPLEEASLAKLERVCQRLNLQSSDHLLEIGTGWGGMAIYAAKHYGCRVTTTTISQEQYRYACERVEKEGLSSRVKVLMQDYRDLSGKYDKLVSIEMIEAVGFQYYSQFFSLCSQFLKPEGLMLIQAITCTDQRFSKEKRKHDFIREYIFPGGCLPSNKVILEHLSSATDMQLVGLEDITRDYAQTLAAWAERFNARVQDVLDLGFDERFIRMWSFYLAYCEGAFAERAVNTAQFLFAKPMCRDLPVVNGK